MANSTIKIRNTTETDDEHNYDAIVYIQPDIVMNKRLVFKSSSGKLEAKFTFWSQSPLIVNEKYLVVLVGVEESEKIHKIDSKILSKTASANEIVDFDFHP
jgi:hypothetical protein